ncbi:hypothetical protein NQL31_007147 [Lotmaria passim]
MLPFRKLVSIGADRTSCTASQTRIYLLIVAFVFCLLFIFVAIFTPLIIFNNQDSTYFTNMISLERTLANAAVTPFRQAISNASVLTKALEGYVVSRMTTLPDLNSSAKARIASQGNDFADFDTILPTITKGVKFVAMVSLQPGGVYAMTWPLEPSMLGRDVLLSTDYAQTLSPTPQDTLRTGKVAYIGPSKSVAKYMHGLWTMTVRRPVYNRTNVSAPIHPKTFWGFTQSSVNISAILETRPFDFRHCCSSGGRLGKVDYLLTTKISNTAQRTVVATSLPKTSLVEVENFILKGTSVAVMPNHPFTVTVRGSYYGARLSANNVTTVVATVIAGLFLVFAIFAAFIIFHCRPYDALRHAPKLAPFAMLTVGPCRGEELWELASDQMVEVTDRLGKMLARQMVRHHAYQIQQVHPLTTSYVTRGVAAAVQMAFDTIEELHRHPIDEPLRRLLGDDGRLLLSYAVHWCNDAVVRLDPMEGGYRYEGPDVVYGGRMWAFAAPSVVTASEAVAHALPRFGLRCLTAEPYRRVNVVRSRSVCGASSGAATIYVPFPALTAAEATAGLGSGGGAAIAAVKAAATHDGDADVVLPSQTLLSLVDTRRPVLVAARDAAPHSHPCPPLSASFPAVAASSPHPAHDAESMNQSGNVRSGSFSHSGEEESTAPVLQAPVPLSVGTELGPSHPMTMAMRRSSLVIEGDGVTRALLRPFIPHALDVALHMAFDYQSITLGMTYDSVRVLVYYFYSSYKILFRPLAAPERHNIYRRLVTAFGVPQQGILEHLAARCAIRCLQQSAKLRQLEVPRRCLTAEETHLSTHEQALRKGST